MPLEQILQILNSYQMFTILLPTDKNDLLDVIFYKLYKLMYGDIKVYLDSNHNLTMLILKSGLGSMTNELLKEKMYHLEHNRIRFLQSYLTEYKQRAQETDVDDNFRLMISVKLAAETRGFEFARLFDIECVESAWKRNTSVLSHANLMHTMKV